MRYKKRKHWKYKTVGDTFHHKAIKPEAPSYGEFLSIAGDGTLLISGGYCYDGASFIVLDTDNVMYPALIHDALYQLIREGVLKQSDRKRADEILRELCLERGMSTIRAWSIYYGLRAGGGHAAKPDILTVD